MTQIYRIADQTIQITSMYPYVHQYCQEYRSSGEASIKVCSTEHSVAYEREKSRCGGTDMAQMALSDAYYETLAVYRQIAEAMPHFDTFLFHGSVVAVDGEGYLFTAKSGTGKSTHTKLWIDLFGERAMMVNDDKPLLRVADGQIIAYGTPWNGKHRRGNPVAVPLKAVCVLERSHDNRICAVSRGEVYPLLMQQMYRPINAAALQKSVGLLDALTECVELYRLGCNMEPEAARVAYDGMHRKK